MGSSTETYNDPLSPPIRSLCILTKLSVRMVEFVLRKPFHQAYIVLRLVYFL